MYDLSLLKPAVVVQSLSHVSLCDPMDCSTPGFPVLHYFLEFTQAHVYCISDAIQPSHPLLFPSPPAFTLPHHQGILQWISSCQLHHQCFQWLFRPDFLYDWLVWSPCCSRDCHESSPTPQFKGVSSLALSLVYGPTLISVYDYWKNHSLD